VLVREINGEKLQEMIFIGAKHLMNNSEMIDALNVFPVPDGDTGTNMNLSMTSGVEEVKKVTSNHASDVSQAFAKGLLMGARGNSGVILSQIFRGFAKGFEGKEVVTAKEFAEALHLSAETAYKAVIKPVEGTILTVIKDTGERAIQVATDDMIALMEEVVAESKRSLQRTPDLLPVLKEVGVVDSGGQGLVTILEGFLSCLKGEDLPIAGEGTVQMDDMVNAEHHKIAQDFMDTEDIEFGYCTEFMVKFEADKLKEHAFDESAFRNELSDHGDSLLVVSDNDVVKVHIHTEFPGNVMTLGQRFGSLINIDIENMREQHTSLLDSNKESTETKAPKQPFAIVTIAMGSGIKEMLESIGATVVIEGGQTMNPSTQDISNAIEKANANKVIILPNNKNIIMAAEQAAEISESEVEVIRTTSIPQGISALLSFNPEASMDDNKIAMEEGMSYVKTGQITYAIRDTTIDGLTIKKGNFMGIAEGEIKSSNEDRLETAKQLLTDLIDEDEDEIVTIIFGEEVEKAEAEQLGDHIEELYGDIEVDVYEGKQPIYSYIMSVE